MSEDPLNKTVPERLFLLRFRVDSASHLIVNQEACRDCAARSCLFVCPADVYKWDEGKNEVIVSFEGCLECGTCRISCGKEALEWKNPKGDCGVSFKYG